MKRTKKTGIDVSFKTLDVRLEGPDGDVSLELANDPTGHQALVKHITKRGGRARVVLEASGHYHLALALALHKAKRVEIMVINPRVARDFAKASMQRSKTDALDAVVLLEYARRMPFKAWVPPAPEEFELQMLARRIANLVKSRTQEKNRLHANKLTNCRVVGHDIKLNIAYLGRRIKALRAGAVKMIGEMPRLSEQMGHLTSLKGIGEAAAIQILGEICILAKDMKARQWVAHAGLDPRITRSGTSVYAPARISRMGNRALRGALFLPALTAIQYEPNVKAFYEKLLANQKKPMQAVVAVMRKLLHAIHGMLRTNTDFVGEKFYVLGR